MRTSARSWLRRSALPAIVLAGAACSSSSPLRRIGDAATTPDLGTPVSPGSDALVTDIPLLSDADQRDSSVVVVDPLARDTRGNGPETDVLSPDPTVRDGAAERAWVCTPGAAGSCNDNPIVSAIWGTCQPNGTCVCTPGRVVNPSSGRCMAAPAGDASTDGETVPAMCTGEYNACGCGCCGGGPRITKCYFPTFGETIAAITAQDLETKAATNCNLAGCSQGVRYLCCLPAAPEASAATYNVSWYIGGIDRMTFIKSGTDCATLTFNEPPMMSSKSAFRVDSPAAWGAASGTFGACGDAGAGQQAEGALGTLVFHVSGGKCVADLHVTLFAFTASGQVQTTRLDVDGFALAGIPPEMCK